jgi:hypothetical protein
MNDIKAWLVSNRDYAAGVKLYDKHGSSTVLKRMFAIGKTTYNENKLRQELVTLSQKVQEKVETVTKLKETGVWTEKDYDSLPDQMKQLIEETKDYYKQIGALKAKLVTHYNIACSKGTIDAANDYMKFVNAGDLANTIRDLEDEREPLLFKINFYQLEKRLPDEPVELMQEILEMSEGDIRAQLSNIRPKITKLKNNAARADERNELIKKKESLERRLDELV